MLFVCTVSIDDAKTKYEIETAGLSVYGLTQAPRLHFSSHAISIV
jgi:hypothetical protein